MTTYHVELTGYCDVIVEANSEQEAFDRAVERIPASSLSIETAEVKGVLEGEALKQAYRYFPEHLAMERTFMEVAGEDDVEVNPLQNLVGNPAHMDYIEACYAAGEKLNSLQYQALYQTKTKELQKLAALV